VYGQRCTKPGIGRLLEDQTDVVIRLHRLFTSQLEQMIFRLFILLAVLSLTTGCGDVYRYVKSGEVSWALKKELRDKGATEVEIRSLTYFKWDEMYIFGPYSMAEEICKQLKIDRAQCDSEVPESSMDDGEMILVFRDKGRVAHVERHIRYHGDFTRVHYGVPISRENAVFQVQSGTRLASGLPQLFLHLKNSALHTDVPQAVHQ
jgi:hypothetical protein